VDIFTLNEEMIEKLKESNAYNVYLLRQKDATLLDYQIACLFPNKNKEKTANKIYHYRVSVDPSIFDWQIGIYLLQLQLQKLIDLTIVSTIEQVVR